MNMYLSTCITGLENVAAKALQQKIPDVAIKSVQDGLLIYATNASYRDLQHLSMMNNTFSLIKTFKGIDNRQKSINAMMKEAIDDKNVFYHLNRKVPPQKRTFRIIISYMNQMIHTDKNVLSKLEQKIVHTCRLKCDPLLPEIEFWFLIRKEGVAYFCIRLTKHTEYAKLLERGELHPELSYMLGFLADIHQTDIVLDPFAGSGAIPFMCEKAFLHKTIIAGDKEKDIVAHLLEKSTKQHLHTQVMRLDALHMSSIQDASINAIVTDPPWGITLGKELNLKMFYGAMLTEFIRVLDLHGRIVILVAKKNIFGDVYKQFSHLLALEQTYHILVSGQKAAIYVLKRKN